MVRGSDIVNTGFVGVYGSGEVKMKKAEPMNDPALV